MRKILAYIIFISVTISCTDVLDKHDLTAIDDGLWNDFGEANSYITDVYADNMPEMSLGENGGYSDEFFTSSEDITNILYGKFTENDIEFINIYSKDNFEKIRKINLGISKLSESSLGDKDKQILFGQLYFFRAWRYWELVKHYGGVPLILDALDYYYDDLEYPRSSTKDCIDQIVKDLDLASDYLPGEWTGDDAGRISSVAAKAFKGRVLLAWASPMFNKSNLEDRWLYAYNAFLEAKYYADSIGYGLNSNFSNIFTDEVEGNPEAILYRRYDTSNDYSNDWEATIRPYSGGGSGSLNPTWNLVKAFPMSNGKKITDDASGYDEVYYWRDRDPRFYATIAYNGCDWDMSGAESSTIWTYFITKTENNRYPSTGFYCRKGSNTQIAYDDVSQCPTAWLEIRYAEVLLGLAECANEVGNTVEAIELISKLRARAGILEDNNYGIGLSIEKDDLRDLIITERQIELAFENKRYWDVRRVKLFTESLSPSLNLLNGSKRAGIRLMPKGVWNSRVNDAESQYNGWRRLDTAAYLGYINIETDYEDYFVVSERSLDSEEINYSDLYYFFPLKSSIIRKNNKLEQTLGWQGGTFDPLAE